MLLTETAQSKLRASACVAQTSNHGSLAFIMLSNCGHSKPMTHLAWGEPAIFQS
jgi:hypothetical protein